MGGSSSGLRHLYNHLCLVRSGSHLCWASEEHRGRGGAILLSLQVIWLSNMVPASRPTVALFGDTFCDLPSTFAHCPDPVGTFKNGVGVVKFRALKSPWKHVDVAPY